MDIELDFWDYSEKDGVHEFTFQNPKDQLYYILKTGDDIDGYEAEDVLRHKFARGMQPIGTSVRIEEGYFEVIIEYPEGIFVEFHPEARSDHTFWEGW